MINGQGLGEVAEIRYGLFPMSFNGCEVISVCNALEYCGKPQRIKSVAKYMFRYSMLLGFFGCNPYCIGRALKHFGVENKRCKKEGAGNAFILSSWTGRPFLSTIHTVFCVRESGRIRVYNRYGKCTHEKWYSSVEKIFENCRIIAIYNIEK